MKSSIKFREEKSPLLRTRLPFKLGPIPLSSGLAVGTKEDLAVHLATGFTAGPIIKLAIKPHDLNPFSVILKAGLGRWGSPNDAPLTLTAEIGFTSNGRDQLLSLRLKPRAGDFSIRKDVNNVKFFPSQQKETATTSVRLQLHENNEQNHVITPLKGENGPVFNSLSFGDAKPAPKHINGNCENVRSPSVDSSNVVTGSNSSLKNEGLEKGRNDRKSKLEVLKEQDVEADISANGNSMIVHVPYEMLHERKKLDSCKFRASFSLAAAQDALRGFRVVTHSSIPLGNQARLNVRWGIKSTSDFFQGWDGSLPSLSLSKLPSLLLDKVSFEQGASSKEKLSMKTSPATTGPFEQGLLPVSFVEENQELAQVASMCYAMKRQLHLMHAENQVLRRAMEEMRSHVGSKHSWLPNGVGDTNSQSVPRLPHKSSFLDVPLPLQEGREVSHRDALSGREGGRRDSQAQKVQKVKPRKDEESHLKSKLPADDNMNVSKELERAILNAQIGSAAGKKE